MMRLGCLLLVFAAAAIAQPRYDLTAKGFGPLQIGMTLQEAEAATGTKFVTNAEASGDPSACETAEIPGWPGVSLMLEDFRITVIYIEKPLRTVDGVHIGMSERALSRLFGKRAVFGPRPYFGGEPRAHNIAVKADSNREFLFQTHDGVVETISVGDLPSVEYWEGCA